MDLIAPNKEYHLKKGDAFFIRRNHLVKKVKRPSVSGHPFKGLFLQLKMPFLKRLIDMHAYPIPMAVEKRAEDEKVFVLLEKHPFLNGLFSSLEQYFDAQQYPSKMLMEAKMEEAVFMLLQLHPELTRTLFDFTETWKIDLKEFHVSYTLYRRCRLDDECATQVHGILRYGCFLSCSRKCYQQE